MLPVVENTIRDAAGNAVKGAAVTIRLIAGASVLAAGYTTDGDIIAPVTISANPSGFWSATLVGNSAISPANTYYQVVESNGAPGVYATSTIVVPASGGPYALSSLLVAPTTPNPPGITGVQVASGGTVAGARPEINLVAGTGAGVSAVDNPAANRVDVTISASPAGAAGGDLTGTYPGPSIAAGAVTSAKIADGTIVDGDISASAGIAESKISGLVADLAAKAADAAVVHVTGTESVAGVKTFTSAPVLALPAVAVTRDVTGAITTYTEAGQATTITRDVAGRIATVTRLGATLTVSRDPAGRLTGVA